MIRAVKCFCSEIRTFQNQELDHFLEVLVSVKLSSNVELLTAIKLNAFP